MRYRKTIRSACQIIIAVIVVLLILSTFVPQQQFMDPDRMGGDYQPGLVIRLLYLDRFYNSPVNLILWALLGLLLIVGALSRGIPRRTNKLMHLLIAVMILVVIYDKAANRRFMLPVREGETVRFSELVPDSGTEYRKSLTLDRFVIERHPGSEMPSSFISHIIVDHSDTTRLEVNKPMAIGNYRLYQSAYDREYLFNVICDADSAQISFGDSVSICGEVLGLESYHHDTHQFEITMEGRSYRISPLSETEVGGHRLNIQPVGEIYISTIEVAEVTGTRLLLAVAILYLAGMAYSFWRRKK